MAPKIATPKTETPQTSFRVPLSTQEAVNRPAMNRRYLAPCKMPNMPTFPEWLRGETPPAVPVGDVAKCLEAWKLLRPAWLAHRLSPEWLKFIADVRQEGHAAQQGMPVLHIDYAAVAAQRDDLISNGERRRFAQTAELQAALDSGFDGVPIAPEKEVADVLTVYLTTDGLEPARALRAVLAKYQIQLNENFALLSPQLRSEERKAALGTRLSPEAQTKIVAESQLAASEHFGQICSNKKNELYRQWNSEARPLEVKLVEGALAWANQCRESAIVAEQDFFAFAVVNHDGTPQTPVARRFDSTIAALNHERDSAGKDQRRPAG